MSLWQVDQDSVLVMKLREQLLGVWTFAGEVDADQAPALGDNVVIKHTAEDGTGTEWRGTVLEAMPHLGRAKLFIVGGAGALREPLAAKQYRNISPALIAEDILREAGEAGPPAADLSGLAGLPILQTWTRTAPKGKCSGSAALTNLCRAVGAGWRMRRDGTVVVGPEQWSAHAGGDPWVTNIDGAKGTAIAAPDHPDVLPGTVLDGFQVHAVEHLMSIDEEESGYRIKLSIEKAEEASVEGRERTQFRRAILSALPPLELSRMHRATVQSQAADGTLDVTVDDDTIPPLSGVTILHGLPGISVKVQQGARVLVGCIGGWRHEADPSAAPDEPEHFAGLWDTAAEFLEISIDGGTQPIARVGDSVHAGWLLGISPPSGGPIQWQYWDADATSLSVPPLPPPGTPGLAELKGGLITSGLDKVKG